MSLKYYGSREVNDFSQMKKYLFLLFVICFLPSAIDPVSKVPSGLMVEFIREPEKVRIMDLKPEFSWIVPGYAKSQSAFQILVSSNKEILMNDTGDIWDSKKTLSSNSSDVEFGGSELKANTTYFWKVRIWSIRNKSSGYSGIQSFRTGDPDGYHSTPNCFEFSFNKSCGMAKFSPGHWLFDFGKDAFGTLLLRISSHKNDTLVILLGEKIAPDGKIDRNPGGSLRYQKVILPLTPGKEEYVLNLPPDSRNTGPSAIHLPDTIGVITPFRYAEIENCPESIMPDDIIQRAVSCFFDDNSSSFTSSDTILNSVWDICKYSMKATSFAGIYVDGDRERIPYEADAYINQLGHYYTDREYSMGRSTSEYFIHHPTWPTEWILQTVPLFYNDFMFTGDPELVRAFYYELKQKTLFSLARGDGLISSKSVNDEIMKSIGFSNPKERIRDIVDWPPAQKDTGWKLAGPDGERDGYEMTDINTVVNAFYYRGLILMSELSGYLDKKEDSLFFSNEALKTYRTFNEKLFDKGKEIYIDGEGSHHSSLHANMTALALGLVPAEHVISVTDFIKSRGMACSVYGSQYLLEALYRAGEDEYALKLLTATNDRSWYNMIRSGSTITMEAWDMKYKPNSDWNHAWGAAPANIIPGFMWGIAPIEPGFAKAVIRPQLGNLKYSKVMVPTIRGSIIAGFRVNGKSKEYSITIPANMKCDFITPGSGKVIPLVSGYNKIVIK
jgi:Bacterial alpha-L-rhamnosidase.